MRFSLTTLALSLLSISAFAAPSTSSSSEVEAESNSTLESRTFGKFCPSGTNWKLTKCCPWDSWEVPFKFRCECSTPGKTLSADGRSCENKCSNSGWKWCNTQCCPEGSDEVHGKCVCSGGKQLVGTGSNKKCVAQCPTGQYFAKTKCCPSSSTEQWDKTCKCDSSHQKLSDDKSKCIDKCPSGWTACASQCCPPGSSEKHGQCVCDDPKKTLKGSGDARKCEYNCATGCSFKDSICCPTDSFEMHGKCQCNDPSKAPNADNTKCESKCTNPGEKYTNGVCCKSYLTGTNGKCVCPTTGQIDDGSKCSACPSGQNYNWITKGCDAACTKSGTSYKVTRRGKGVCCRSGHTACETVCCPSGTDEVGTSGKCCKSGSTLDAHGNCLEPSHVPRAIKRNGPAEIQLELPSTYFGLNGNANNALCPARTAACPIEGRGDDDYECIDTTSDLQSCGGCASMGEGVDCTLIQGAKWMGCVKGQCEVYSCGKGYKLVDGSCRRA